MVLPWCCHGSAVAGPQPVWRRCVATLGAAGAVEEDRRRQGAPQTGARAGRSGSCHTCSTNRLGGLEWP
eukprot:365433-Chlamydomonas_euryale.AAC.14